MLREQAPGGSPEHTGPGGAPLGLSTHSIRQVVCWFPFISIEHNAVSGRSAVTSLLSLCPWNSACSSAQVGLLWHALWFLHSAAMVGDRKGGQDSYLPLFSLVEAQGSSAGQLCPGLCALCSTDIPSVPAPHLWAGHLWWVV